MSRVNPVNKGSVTDGDWSRISTPVIVATIVGVVAVVLLLFVVNREKGFGENQFNTAPVAVPSSGPTFKVTVRLLETLDVGDGLSITLTTVQQQPGTKKYKIWAKVLVRGLPEMQIKRAEEGATITYPEEHGYTIGVIKATADWAKFSITKNP